MNRRDFLKLRDDGLPTLFSVYPEGVGIRNEGLFGGRPGGDARGVALNADGHVTHDCGTGELVTLADTTGIVEVQLAGGSGYGDPRQRARRDLDRDVADGCVTPDAAAREYGGQAKTA